MASTFQDTVFDFDLNLLVTGNSVVNRKAEKHRKALLTLKKKLIATHSIVNKYLERNELVNVTQRTLAVTKEELKQIYIELQNALDKSTKLEQDVQTLQRKNQELKAKSIASEAMQSHNIQLQQLLKDKVSDIEALKVENQLVKDNIKNFERTISSLKKEKNVLWKHIRIIGQVASGKKKLNHKIKIILETYKIICDKPCIEPLTGEGNSGDEDDIFYDPSMSLSSTERKNAHVIGKFELNVKNGNGSSNVEKYIDQDSDDSHELPSLDTGRGSSLAFSDSDKCFHSPDYFINDSPISTETSGSKDNRNKNDIGTSPVKFTSQIDVSTSPIEFEHCENPVVRSNLEDDQSCSLPRIVIDRVNSIDFNPIKETSDEKGTTYINTINDTVYNKDKVCEITLQEKECLESNNSINFHKDNSNDYEIETILNAVRLPHELTPIPSTPTKSRASVVTCQSTPDLYNEQTKLICQDASKARKENKGANGAAISDKVNIVWPEMSLNDEEDNWQVNIDSSNKEPRFMSNVESIKENISKPETSQIKQFQNLSAAPAQKKLNLSRQLLFEEQPELNDLMHDSGEIEPTSGVIENKKNRKAKKRKMTKLDKMRKKMLPKSKIQRVKTPSPKKLLIKPQQLTYCKKKVMDSDNSASLNDKKAYDKAVKIISEQNKQMCKRIFNSPTSVPIVRLQSIRTSTQANNDGNNISCEEIKSNCVKSSSVKSSITTRRRAHGNNIPSKEESHPVTASPLKSSITTRKRGSKLAKGADGNISREKIENDRANSSSPKSSVTTRRHLSRQAKVTDVNNIFSEEENHHVNSSPLKSSITTGRRISMQAKETDHNNVPCDELESPLLNPSSIKTSVTTRSRSKRTSYDNEEVKSVDDSNSLKKNEVNIKIHAHEAPRKQLKRASLENPELESKRILRSTTVNQNNIVNNCLNSERQLAVAMDVNNLLNPPSNAIKTLSTGLNVEHDDCNKIKDYSDLNLFTNESPNEANCQERALSVERNPQESVLFKMIEKYGISHMKHSPKMVLDSPVHSYAKKIEEGITQVIELPPNDVTKAMDKMVEVFQCWTSNKFLLGLTKYLKDPTRKVELFSKVHVPPAPAMTKSEQVLLYIVTKLRTCWPDIDLINCILNNIEYILFRLNRTPEFDTIESMSHFYAVLCRYIKAKSRLRLFILDAMYCIQFKAVPLIKQCLDVWSHVIPLAHIGLAKSPLVICLVYLLHFFKCEDKFNRVQTLRNILSQQYSYEITKWNDSKILEMFRTSIMELRDIPIEVKMLRMALIILAKRQGARWCQHNIIKNLLQPMIEKETVPEKVKLFCVSMMGPLLKPYPADMKVHCEISMNQLIDMLDGNPTQHMQESIVQSLIYMSKHNQNKVLSKLVQWTPKEMSQEMEVIFKNYVREKSVKVWLNVLSKISITSK